VTGGITAFSTATETASITVNPVNDNPTTTGIPAVTVNEDAPNTVLNLRLSFNDVEDGNDLAYTVQPTLIRRCLPQSQSTTPTTI
jgi:hypothetical protein